MKKSIIRKLFLTTIIMLAMIGIVACGDSSKKNSQANIVGEEKISILFTHDIHSHLDTMPKLKTLVDEKTENGNAYILVDGGDIAMGTLYQTVYEEYAPDLVLLGKVGFDATTFGNHEFDYLPIGLSNMLHSAKKVANEQNVSLPALVVSNIDWNKNTTDDNKLIQTAMQDYGSTEYIIVERNGVKFGIYGVLGEEAAEDAPMSGLTFDSIIDSSKRIVKELKEQGVDVIVCLSHSGTNPDPKKSEDELLAKAVPEIDVIVSAHTHTRIDKPIVHGNTTIVAQGCYLENLGELTLMKNADGRWTYVDYNLIDFDESIKEDSGIKQELENYKQLIEKEYLSRFGYTYNQVLAHNEIDFYSVDDMYAKHGENGLGNIISDSFMYAVWQAEGENYVPITMTIEPVGVVRDTFRKGDITTSDVFNVSSLGIGEDKITGYPLTEVYLTGEEIMSVAEIDASVSYLMNTAQLHPSGVSFIYNNRRIFLNKVTEVRSYDTTNGVVESYENGVKLEKDKLYRVVAGLYSVQMLGAVEKTSYGLIKIVPKDRNGNPVTDYNKLIIHDQNGNEIKEWVAIANYISSFEKVDGVPQFPERYASVEGRKVDKNSFNPVELFKNTNKLGLIIYAIIIVLIIIFVLLIKLIIKIIKKIVRKIKEKKRQDK